ncbi:hypothetical protein ACWFRJ_30590 [Streptomyces sp. NPDC055239]
MRKLQVKAHRRRSAVPRKGDLREQVILDAAEELLDGIGFEAMTSTNSSGRASPAEKPGCAPPALTDRSPGPFVQVPLSRS